MLQYPGAQTKDLSLQGEMHPLTGYSLDSPIQCTCWLNGQSTSPFIWSYLLWNCYKFLNVSGYLVASFHVFQQYCQVFKFLDICWSFQCFWEKKCVGSTYLDIGSPKETMIILIHFCIHYIILHKYMNITTIFFSFLFDSTLLPHQPSLYILSLITNLWAPPPCHPAPKWELITFGLFFPILIMP